LYAQNFVHQMAATGLPEAVAPIGTKGVNETLLQKIGIWAGM
jgi:hypothetical protein